MNDREAMQNCVDAIKQAAKDSKVSKEYYGYIVIAAEEAFKYGVAHARHGLPPVPEGFPSWEDYLASKGYKFRYWIAESGWIFETCSGDLFPDENSHDNKATYPD